MPDRRKYADRREALIKAVAKRRKKIKALSIEYKGGKCQLCGYSRYQGALELHHLNPKEKSFAISDKGYTRAWTIVQRELDKCVLLCANCHREVSAGIQQLPDESQVVKEVNSVEPSSLNLNIEFKELGNTEPSKEQALFFEGVETIPDGSTQSYKFCGSASSLTRSAVWE